MVTIDELLAEIDWDVFTEEDVDEHAEEVIKERYEAVKEDKKQDQFSVRQAQNIITSRMNVAERAKAIKREAVADADLLTELISRKQLTELIRLIVKPDTDKTAQLVDYINYNARLALSPLIPKDVIRVYNRYKNKNTSLMPRSPGFLYKASPEWGRYYDFWVTPDIPCYLPQFMEQSLIEQFSPDRLLKMDKHIIAYHRTIQNRSKLELRLASKLYGIVTRYDLLMCSADFYKIYMDNELYLI